MTPVLLVDLNRGELHEVDAPATFSTDRAFSVELRNHGDPVHVHVRADEALSGVARIDADGNLFVERETTQSVPVGVDGVDSPVAGTLEIATGYGSETHAIEVTVEPEDDEGEVDVDETLSRPPEPDGRSSPPTGDRLASAVPGWRTVAVLLLALAAVGVAGGLAYTVRSPAVLVGAGVVGGAVLVALAVLFK